MIQFPAHNDDFPRDRWSIRRYKFTLAFIEKHIKKGATILDLGTVNGLGNFIADNGYKVINTTGEDFDSPQGRVQLYLHSPDCVTALEVLEHLWSPLELLRSLQGFKLIVSIPLRLWFTPPFKGRGGNLAGRHTNEMTDWQIQWLLEKAGWTVLDTERHTAPTFKIGFRTLLRWVTPRYYLLYCERK